MEFFKAGGGEEDSSGEDRSAGVIGAFSVYCSARSLAR